MKRPLLALLALCALTAMASAQSPCTDVHFENADYTICTAKPGRDDIRLFLKNRDGRIYGGFTSVRQDLAPGKRLVFAMNAGMYQENRNPVGLYVENGKELQRLNLRSGPGNFHMRPNGIFYLNSNGAGVMEAERFNRSGIKPLFATQSGPMLVVDDKIHPKILPTGTSAKLRNGVGVARDGMVYFAISNQPVTFSAFARLFRERLRCPNALFLDGTVSTLYAPENGRESDPFIPLGPMIGVVSGRN